MCTDLKSMNHIAQVAIVLVYDLIDIITLLPNSWQLRCPKRKDFHLENFATFAKIHMFLCTCNMYEKFSF